MSWANDIKVLLSVGQIGLPNFTQKMMKVFRDYCGVINEETIRKNFVLIYEIIDEIIDYGHP